MNMTEAIGIADITSACETSGNETSVSPAMIGRSWVPTHAISAKNRMVTPDENSVAATRHAWRRRVTAEQRRWTPFLLGMAVATVLVIAAALLATRTDAGRERILAITLNALGGQLHPDSRLEVQRLEGGLFTGARMYGVSLLDPGGEALAVVDSARIRYRVASFFRGDVVLDEVSGVSLSEDVVRALDEAAADVEAAR